MSTPSSIVGEQNSTGSVAVRKRSSRSSRSSGRHLGGVLARFDALRAARLVAVEVDEELVRAPAVGRRARHADRVVRGRRPVAGEPAQLRGGDLVAGDAVRHRVATLLDEPVASQRFEDARR